MLSSTSQDKNQYFSTLTAPFFTQSKNFHHAFNHESFKYLETLTFCENMSEEKLMRIITRYVNLNDLSEGFYAMRETLAKIYDCSMSWITTLTDRLVENGLLIKIPTFFQKETKTMNTFFLTEHSQNIMRQVLDMSEGQQYLTQVTSDSENLSYDLDLSDPNIGLDEPFPKKLNLLILIVCV